jgi:MFS family permease
VGVLPALAVLGVGIGVSETGATGILLKVVTTERIISAMVVWSQMGIVGYLIAPVAGGAVAETVGYAGLGLIPATVSVALIGVSLYARRRNPVRRQRQVASATP